MIFMRISIMNPKMISMMISILIYMMNIFGTRLFCTPLKSGQWHKCSLVNDTDAECWVKNTLSALVSLTIGQWYKCRNQAFLHFFIERSMTRMQLGQWHGYRMMSVNHTQCMRVIDHRSMKRMPEPGFFALPYRAVNDTNAVRSMTRMQIAEYKSDSVHSCHWPSVNDTNAGTRLFCTSLYRAVNDTNAVWSMTRMQIAEFKSHSVHSCHWPSVGTRD